MACPLEELVQSDMTSAMKNHDERRLTTLRMLKTAIQLASTEKGRGGCLSDEDIHALIRRGVKQREEAAEMYIRGGARDRAESELEESRILSEYLPAQMGDDELERVIGEVVSSLGASGPKDMGRVMSGVMKVVGGRADGKRAQEAARKILG